jgi:hypothetical protein
MNRATAPRITPWSSMSGTAVTMPHVPSQELTTRSLTTKPSPFMISPNQGRSLTLTVSRNGADVQVRSPFSFATAAPAYWSSPPMARCKARRHAGPDAARTSGCAARLVRISREAAIMLTSSLAESCAA